MATTRIQSGGVTAQSITHDKLHTDMNLSTKTVVLPTISALNVTNTLGLGVTPGVWSVNYPALQIGQGATLTGHKSNTQTQLGQNWWVGTGNQYVVNGSASRLVMGTDSTIEFSQAPSGSAGATMSTINTRLIIKPSGDIGIGTNDPKGKLHVGSTSGTENIAYISQQKAYGTGTGTAEKAKLVLSIDEPGYPANTRHFAEIFTGPESESTSSEGYLAFSTRNGGNATQKMIIDGAGNVGINIPNPSTTLHVGGIVQVVESSETAFYGGNYARVFGSSQEYGFRNTGGATIANISMSGNSYFNGGNVGFGTNTPRRQMHIHNSASPAATVGLQLTNGGTGQTNDSQGFQLKVGSDTHAELAQMENSDLRIFTNAEERIRISSTGNVGIGRTAESHYTGYTALDIGHSSSLFGNKTGSDTNVITLANNGYLNSTASAWKYIVTDEATKYEQSSGRHRWFHASSGTAGTDVTWTNSMAIDASGNVGIGTDSPDSFVDIRGDESKRLILSNQTAAPTNGESLPPTLEFHGRGWNTNQGNRFIKSKIEYVADYGDYGAGATQGSLRFSMVGAGGSGNAPNTEQVGMTLAGGSDSVPYPRLGIGTTTPAAALHVYIPPIAAGTDLQGQGIVVSTPFTSGYQYQSSSLLSGYDGALHGTSIGMVYESPGYALTFFRNNNTSGLPTESARINHNGLVVVSDTSNSTTADNIAIRYKGTAGGHMSGYLFRDKRDTVNAAIKNDLQDDSTSNYAAGMHLQTTHAGTLTTQMSIDRHGHVTMPNQPSFRAYTSTDYTTNQTMEGSPGVWAEQHDNNGDFSNGRFTAPVDGVYLFEVMWDALGTQSGINLLVNSNIYRVKWEPTGRSDNAWESRHYSTTVQLSQNDYVRLVGVHGSGANPFHMGGGHWGSFSGHLLG